MKNRKGVSEMCCRSPEGEVLAPLSLQAVEQHEVLTLVASANFLCPSTPSGSAHGTGAHELLALGVQHCPWPCHC